MLYKKTNWDKNTKNKNKIKINKYIYIYIGKLRNFPFIENMVFFDRKF